MNCLRALLEQSLDKYLFEVIVVSDGPDEETFQCLQPWLKKRRLNLTYLSTPEKKGPAAARNLGWLSARAPLVAFTDDDCLPQKKWLRSFLDTYRGERMIAYTGFTSVPLPPSPTDFALTTAGLQEAEFITANCACTKDALLKCGGFDEQFKLAWREDSDLHFKLLKLEVPIIHVPRAMVVHPVRPASWGVSVREQKKSQYDALLYQKFPDLYRSRIHSSLWNYYVINLLWLVLITALATRQHTIAVLATCSIFLLVADFAIKRLKNTQKTPLHILEMLSTSIIIPTLSVYWRLYGAFKYRVLFI